MPAAEQPEDPGLARRLDEVTDDLAELIGVLNEEEDIGRALQRSVEQMTDAVPGADMASVTVLRDGKGETVASSEERVWAIDADQYAAGDGPCLEAARTGKVIRVSIERARERWPDFTRSARAAGVASYLSHPLLIEDDFAGSLNLYSERPHGFSDFDVSVLRLYVTAASAAVANARRYARARDLVEHLRQAVDSHAVVDQAIGVLMARRGLTAARARAELFRESQNRNVKLRVVAQRLIDSAVRGP